MEESFQVDCYDAPEMNTLKLCVTKGCAMRISNF